MKNCFTSSSWWPARLVCLLGVVVVWFNLLEWSGKHELDHDELEHAHAAWLMHQGLEPYEDFFEHHPPYYWYFLGLYYDVHGENPGIFRWGRAWMLITYAGAIFFLYLIGRELFGEVTGLAAAVFFGTNRLAHFTGMIMRSDGWMLLLLFAGTYIYLHTWKRNFRWYSALSAGALLGLSFGVLPKSGFTILALALLTAYQCHFKTGWTIVWRRKVALMLFAATSVVPIILPFVLYGADYYHHMYVVATNVLPTFSPWPMFVQMSVRSYLLLPFAFLGIWDIIARIRRNPRNAFEAGALALFLLLNLLQVLITARPFIQAFNTLIPFYCLVAALGVNMLATRLPVREQNVLLSAVAVAGTLFVLSMGLGQAENRLKQQTTRMQALMNIMPEDEVYAGSMMHHPIFRRDGTYYWWDLDMTSLQAVDPDFLHDFVEEFRKTRPMIIHETMMERLSFDPVQVPRMRAYIQQHYDQSPGSLFWIRKPETTD